MTFDRERMERAIKGPHFRLPDHVKTAEEICAFLDSLALFHAISENKELFTAEAAHKAFAHLAKD